MKELTVDQLIKLAESCDIRLVQRGYDAPEGLTTGQSNRNFVAKINAYFNSHQAEEESE